MLVEPGIVVSYGVAEFSFMSCTGFAVQCWCPNCELGACVRDLGSAVLILCVPEFYCLFILIRCILNRWVFSVGNNGIFHMASYGAGVVEFSSHSLPVYS